MIQTSAGSFAALALGGGGNDDEAVEVGGVGRGQRVLPVLDHLRGAAEVDLPGREQPRRAVPVASQGC